jgi:fimbrial chaperone protein
MTIMTLRSFLRTAVAAASAGALALLASHARASFALKVTPIPITIADGATSTMAEIENDSDDPLRVQAQGFDWTQSPTGEDKLAPSAELLLFPSMVVVKPHESRKIRIGTQGGYGAGEKSFRVIFAEIPPEFTPANGENELLKVVAHVSVPVFVKPPGAAGAPRVEGLTATKDRLRFAVRNTGNAHALVERIKVEAIGEGGKSLGSTEIAGWYVLPGQSRPFDVDVAKSNVPCAGAKQLIVTAISRDSGKSTAGIDHPACAGP